MLHHPPANRKWKSEVPVFIVQPNDQFYRPKINYIFYLTDHWIMSVYSIAGHWKNKRFATDVVYLWVLI